MKAAPRQKRTETALWARRIFGDSTSAKTAGRNFAMEKNRFAKASRLAPWVNQAVIGYLAKKLLSSVFSYPSFVLRLRWYSLALRFKRCPLTSDRRSLTSEFARKFHRTKQTATGINFMNLRGSCS